MSDDDQQLANATDDEVREEIKRLEEIEATLIEETEKIADAVKGAVVQFEEKTAVDRQALQEASAALVELSKKADEEELAGARQAVDAA